MGRPHLSRRLHTRVASHRGVRVTDPVPDPLANKPRLRRVAVPAAALGVALLLGAVLLLILGANPFKAYAGLVNGAIGGKDQIAQTIFRSVPLMLVAAGICISFRASVINIGGEGQIVMGALFTVMLALALPEGLPKIIALPLALVAGFVGGGLFGAIPGALKAYFNVNEILSTIMLNIVAVQIMNFLLRGPLIDPAQDGVLSNIPQTRRLPKSTDLPVLLPRTSLNFGLVVGLLAAVAAFVLLWKTPLGYRLRAVGYSPAAARYAGIPVTQNIVAALSLSGAFCGLAGAVLVLGGDSHRLFTDGSASGFTGDAGFNGIIAALFGGLHPLWSIPAALLFGALRVGANQMQRDVQIPAALVTAINGLIVLFVVSSDRLRRRLAKGNQSPDAGVVSDEVDLAERTQ